MDIKFCSSSIAYIDILYGDYSEIHDEWCRLGDSNTRPTDYKILINNRYIIEFLAIYGMNNMYNNL